MSEYVASVRMKLPFRCGEGLTASMLREMSIPEQWACWKCRAEVNRLVWVYFPDTAATPQILSPTCYWCAPKTENGRKLFVESKHKKLLLALRTLLQAESPDLSVSLTDIALDLEDEEVLY